MRSEWTAWFATSVKAARIAFDRMLGGINAAFRCPCLALPIGLQLADERHDLVPVGRAAGVECVAEGGLLGFAGEERFHEFEVADADGVQLQDTEARERLYGGDGA